MSCPKCQSTNIRKSGFVRLRRGFVQRMQCKDCGRSFYGEEKHANSQPNPVRASNPHGGVIMDKIENLHCPYDGKVLNQTKDDIAECQCGAVWRYGLQQDLPENAGYPILMEIGQSEYSHVAHWTRRINAEVKFTKEELLDLYKNLRQEGWDIQ